MAFNSTDLAAWRTSRGRVGVQELPDVPGLPFALRVDYSGLTELAINGKVPNPLIAAALRGLDAATTEAERLQAEPEGTRGQALLAVKLQLDEATARWQDAILAAFIVDPPYLTLDALPPGGCPEDAICLHDLPAGDREGEVDCRTPLVALALGGYTTLDTFRTAVASPTARADGGEVGAVAEQLVSSPDATGSVPPRPSLVHAVGARGDATPATARPTRAPRPTRPARHAG